MGSPNWQMTPQTVSMMILDNGIFIQLLCWLSLKHIKLMCTICVHLLVACLMLPELGKIRNGIFGARQTEHALFIWSQSTTTIWVWIHKAPLARKSLFKLPCCASNGIYHRGKRNDMKTTQGHNIVLYIRIEHTQNTAHIYTTHTVACAQTARTQTEIFAPNETGAHCTLAPNQFVCAYTWDASGIYGCVQALMLYEHHIDKHRPTDRHSVWQLVALPYSHIVVITPQVLHNSAVCSLICVLIGCWSNSVDAQLNFKLFQALVRLSSSLSSSSA